MRDYAEEIVAPLKAKNSAEVWPDVFLAERGKPTAVSEKGRHI